MPIEITFSPLTLIAQAAGGFVKKILERLATRLASRKPAIRLSAQHFHAVSYGTVATEAEADQKLIELGLRGERVEIWGLLLNARNPEWAHYTVDVKASEKASSGRVFHSFRCLFSTPPPDGVLHPGRSSKWVTITGRVRGIAEVGSFSIQTNGFPVLLDRCVVTALD